MIPKTIATVEDGTFTIEEAFEDVHSKIEFKLTEKIGEAGKKIHTARSRNDQVLVDLHLYVKEEIIEIKELVIYEDPIDPYEIDPSFTAPQNFTYLRNYPELEKILNGR